MTAAPIPTPLFTAPVDASESTPLFDALVELPSADFLRRAYLRQRIRELSGEAS